MNAGLAVTLFVTAYGSGYVYVFVHRPPAERYSWRLLKRR